MKSDKKCVALSCVSNYAGLISTSGREGFDSPTLVFLIYIFFFPFSSQLLPLPVLLFQQRGMNTASWIPTQRGEGQHSNSLPRHLICAWQPADRMGWWGWGGGAGRAGEGKGYRMRWGKYKKRPGGGGFIGEEMRRVNRRSEPNCVVLFYFPPF